jgi:hypothetical protein
MPARYRTLRQIKPGISNICSWFPRRHAERQVTMIQTRKYKYDQIDNFCSDHFLMRRSAGSDLASELMSGHVCGSRPHLQSDCGRNHPVCAYVCCWHLTDINPFDGDFRFRGDCVAKLGDGERDFGLVNEAACFCSAVLCGRRSLRTKMNA